MSDDGRPGHGPDETPQPKPDRPVNQPPLERPLQPPPEGWIRVWIPVTLLLVAVLFVVVRAVMGSGEAWAECQLRYVQAETGADSAEVDALRLDLDDVTTCGALRIGR